MFSGRKGHFVHQGGEGKHRGKNAKGGYVARPKEERNDGKKKIWVNLLLILGKRHAVNSRAGGKGLRGRLERVY